MSWGSPLPPFVKIVPKMRAAICVTKAGAKIHLTASDIFYRELGEPERVNVLPGMNENAGKIMIVPADDGSTPVTAFERGGGRIIIPIIEGVPEGYEFEAIACDVGEVDTGTRSVVLTLPVKAWADGVARAEAAEQAVSAPSESGSKPARGGGERTGPAEWRANRPRSLSDKKGPQGHAAFVDAVLDRRQAHKSGTSAPHRQRASQNVRTARHHRSGFGVRA
jgi:hypothetical protein